MLHTWSISYTYFSFKGAFHSYLLHVIDFIAVVMGVMIVLALVLYQQCVCVGQWVCVCVCVLECFRTTCALLCIFIFPAFASKRKTGCL